MTMAKSVNPSNTEIPTGYQRCKKCEILKPLTAQYWYRLGEGFEKHQCKACRNLRPPEPEFMQEEPAHDEKPKKKASKPKKSIKKDAAE